jgi:hypothetical protein
MKIYVDIDDTVCYYDDLNCSPDKRYPYAIPHMDRIKKINTLYEQGNIIVYWTARGTVSGINWFELTLKQLNEWGCKFHELKMGKPAYDLFIDDKNINCETYFN